MLRGFVGSLKDTETHQQLCVICERLGMRSPGPEGSKRDRLLDSFDATSESDLIGIAENYVRYYVRDAETRNRIQELIWLNTPSLEVPKRFRREVANRLDGESLFLSSKHFMELLDSLWITEDPWASLLGTASTSLKSKIERHVVMNPGDWPVDHLFEELGAYICSDRRFLLFLEGLVSSDVRPNVEAQREFVNVLNAALQPCQIELRPTGEEGGYPVYTAVAVGKGVKASVKNLIFASPMKPDLRFSDAINNDVEVVSNQDQVLIYDRPIGPGGLTWQELQNWFAEKHPSTAEMAKKALYYRLRDSLPENSPPQRLLFESYFRRFTDAIPLLPALLPEVWLYWDPKTVLERGKDALLRFRMDFLMLFPNGVRIVIEVDGKHHFSDASGQPSPQKYAEMVAADRDLRLAGYDVYRFGAVELSAEQGFHQASDFFERLFRFYKLPVHRKLST